MTKKRTALFYLLFTSISTFSFSQSDLGLNQLIKISNLKGISKDNLIQKMGFKLEEVKELTGGVHNIYVDRTLFSNIIILTQDNRYSFIYSSRTDLRKTILKEALNRGFILDRMENIETNLGKLTKAYTYKLGSTELRIHSEPNPLGLTYHFCYFIVN